MMFQRKAFIILFTLMLGFSLMLSGCSSSNPAVKPGGDEKLQVVASISIIADIAQNIGRDRINISYLVPRGENPEDFELLPSDLKQISNANVVILNGWNLERMIESSLANINITNVIYAPKGLTPIPLVGETAADPHAWLDARLVTEYYVPNILQALIAMDAENADYYQENAQAYKQELRELDAWIREQVTTIPEKNRVIVISENALKYYGEAYGFQTEGIWELNAHEEGTPQQISRIIDLVRNTNLPAVFVESTLDHRYMNTISVETKVPIAGELHTDALGIPGSEGDTYIGMMRHNTTVIVNGLK